MGIEFSLRPRISFENRPENFGEELSDSVRSAIDLAVEIHKDDKRKVSGEPYVFHCIAVASILEKWGADEDEIIAGLLHDTLEDHPDMINLDLIRELFGNRVMSLVDGVTVLKTAEEKTDYLGTLKKITKKSLIEPGVAMIKLADRLHNMMEQEGMKPESQKRNSLETLRFHGPLAESFGLWQVKNMLEDLAFQYLDPVKFWRTKQVIDTDPRLEMSFITRIENEISQELKRCGIGAEVEHQVGGYWEVVNKQKKLAMKANTWSNSFSAITDVISFRVLVEEGDLTACYQAMGAVRLLYGIRIEKRRHDDYLGVPSVNGYSALHDTYKFDEGNIEIAFTTKDRERFNNWGVVSIDKKLLLESPEKFVRKLIFTPKNELVFMKPTDTGIDIAYKVNPLLGLKAVAIKVDGEVMGLEQNVAHGSSVEVLFDVQRTTPDLKWLKFCNKETRKLIERQLAISERDVEIQSGKMMLVDKVLKGRGILNLGDLEKETLDKLLMSLGCWGGLSDLYYKVSYGFDLEFIKNKLDEAGITVGKYTTIQVRGENKIGISKDVAEVVAKHGGDGRNNVEKVNKDEQVEIRMLIIVDYQGKRRIEEELKRNYSDCVVV